MTKKWFIVKIVLVKLIAFSKKTLINIFLLTLIQLKMKKTLNVEYMTLLLVISVIFKFIS